MTTATAVLAAGTSPAHPAFRWTPLDGAETQHRRRPGLEETACGLVGPLLLADTTAPRCTAGCWPEAPRDDGR